MDPIHSWRGNRTARSGSRSEAETPHAVFWRQTGTHHVIFSVGYAMQQLGMKILNDIAWEKPNLPPNQLTECWSFSVCELI
jgi:site-specific DNA-methyltransferase (adenine-specific)